MFNTSKPWYKSKTYWGGLLMFVAALLENFIAVWVPVIQGETIIVDSHAVTGMVLKTIPLIFSAIGLVGVMVGRNSANTTIS